MDSDDDNDFMYDEDELSDPEDDQDDFDISCHEVEAAGEPSAKRHMKDEEEFSYDCLTPESIVVTMKKSIDEVNSVFEVFTKHLSSLSFFVFIHITFTCLNQLI